MVISSAEIIAELRTFIHDRAYIDERKYDMRCALPLLGGVHRSYLRFGRRLVVNVTECEDVFSCVDQ